MSVHIPFDNSFARLGENFYAAIAPEPVGQPTLLAYNTTLGESLGITQGSEAEMAQVFSGNQIADGSEPLAQLYAGHQFGHFSPQLGDGRAHLLGEVATDQGRFDIQLKGSGRTPFSRMGDGRAWLGPVLREYVVSEAMHALGIPTSRALAAVSTGEIVLRESPLPGAVLTRVASSHLRVGHFQVYSARRQQKELQDLFDYAVARHAPQAKDPLEFLQTVISRQAELVAKWMAVGFIHGVMNTDNCTISGETIDYGPCAFMDDYHPQTVFSSIDRHGRYAYAAQADIIVWNMAQLATALVPLMPDADDAIARFTQAVHAMPDQLRTHWRQAFGAKIGIENAAEDDAELIRELLDMMAQTKADFTNTFRALTKTSAAALDHPDFQDWHSRWRSRLASETDPETGSETDPESRMANANPWIIPRNHQIEAMITAATNGDMGPFARLMEAYAAPYAEQPGAEDLTNPPTPEEVVPATFCGT